MSIKHSHKKLLWIERQLYKKSQSPISQFLIWLMVLIASLFYAYEYVLRIAPGALLDFFHTKLHLGTSKIGNIEAAYYWLYTPMQILVGPLIDHYGVRKLLLVSIISCVWGSYLFSSETYHLILIGRMIIGFGSAFAFVAVLKIASEWLHRKYFPLISGLTTALGMLGAYLGEVSMTHLVDVVGPQKTMFYSIMFGGLLIVLTAIFVRNRSPIHRNEATKRTAILYGSLKTVMSDSQIWILGMIGGALFLPTVVFGSWGPSYFQHIREFSRIESAHLASTIFIGWMCGAPLVGYAASHYNCKRILVASSTVLACIMTLGILFIPFNSLLYLTAMMFLLGFFSSPEILVFTFAFERSKKALTATAVAVTNMIIMISGFMQPLIGRVIEYGSIFYDDTPPSHAFTQAQFEQAFLLMPIVLLLAFLLTFMVKTPTKQK